MERTNLGYTLVELLVVSTLLLIILLGATTLLIGTVTTDVKTTFRQEMRAEGNFALDSMAFMIRNADSLSSCDTLPPGNEDLIVLTPYGTYSTFKLDSGRIASISGTAVYLTSPEYAVTDFEINCQTGVAGVKPPYATISFTLSRNDFQGNTVSNDFRRTAIMRNLQ